MTPKNQSTVRLAIIEWVMDALKNHEDYVIKAWWYWDNQTLDAELGVLTDAVHMCVTNDNTTTSQRIPFEDPNLFDIMRVFIDSVEFDQTYVTVKRRG